MKILILGAGGMLGHKIYMKLKTQFEVFAVARSNYSNYKKLDIYDPSHFIDGVEVTDRKQLTDVLARVQPHWIINCVGVTLRKITIPKSQIIEINSVLPQWLNEWADKNKARLIHFSTDCVFSGSRGNYTESDTPDAQDLYGISKRLGEVLTAPGLTIRSSIVGHEIQHFTELFEWAFSQMGKSAKGYSHVYYTGVTTNYMAYLVTQIIQQNPELYGLHQLASPKISKFDLLLLLNQELDLNIRLENDPTKASDKSLVTGRLFEILKDVDKPEWGEMIREIKNEHPQYMEWKRL